MKHVTSRIEGRNYKVRKNKEEIVHIAPFKSTAEKINGEIYIPKTAIVSWLRACALDEATTEVPRNVLKAISANIEEFHEIP